MILTQEVAWEQSAVARMKGLFRIGNGVWLDERLPGYPVNRMRHFVGHYVTAYGRSAAELRESRAELWSKQAGFALGFGSADRRTREPRLRRHGGGKEGSGCR